jgi:hypothetical protein
VELWEALDMLDVEEEVLGRLAEAGKVKSRRADGTIYFLREEIDQIIDREIEVVRSGECKPDQLVSRMEYDLFRGRVAPATWRERSWLSARSEGGLTIEFRAGPPPRGGRPRVTATAQ